jgi:hypothetical protein
VARLYPRGTAKLKSDWTVYLASVRNRFFDHIDAAAITHVAEGLSALAGRLEDGSSAGTEWDREAVPVQTAPPSSKACLNGGFEHPELVNMRFSSNARA